MVEMNGLDTLQKVRTSNPDVYVILFSSQKGLNTKEVFLQYGSFDFLEKNSLSLRTLRQMVDCAILPAPVSLPEIKLYFIGRGFCRPVN